MTGVVEMVRPHDLRPGDRIVHHGVEHTVTSRPLPQLSDRRRRLVVLTEQGQVSWSLDEATWPQVERRCADRSAA